MNKNFVSLEISYLLHDLGFNELCFACYDVCEMLSTHSGIFLPTNYNVPGSVDISCPLWQQAIDWLRINHRILIEISQGGHLDTYHVFLGSYGYIYGDDHHINEFDYYEAREQAILKAIEIIKNK